MEDTRHVALPKLYGAPAYARPPVAVAHTPRPVDPDDLPILAEMTDDERTLAERLAMARQHGQVPGATAIEGAVAVAPAPDALHPRPFSVRGFADRIRRPRP